MRLALRYRPTTIDDIISQEHLVGKDGAIRRFLENKKIPHMFFFGPPGVGKTSLARIISKDLDYHFYELNATNTKVEDLRAIFKAHKNTLARPLIFIDEVHRLSKNQQEVLLEVMEEASVLIIGASTQNPFFSLTNAIRSRSFLFEFKPISEDGLTSLVQKVARLENIKIDTSCVKKLCLLASFDARRALNYLEFASTNGVCTLESLNALAQDASSGTDKDDEHYDLASAFIKSMRGSDENASLYYLARLIASGEDPRFIARRLVIFASEDIGNANPNALTIANDAMNAAQTIGMPEARIILAQATIYLALSPKSNAAYVAIDKALDLIRSGEIQSVPNHLRDSHYAGSASLGVGGYKYPHDYGGYVEQDYMQKPLDLINMKGIGFEKILLQWKDKIISKK